MPMGAEKKDVEGVSYLSHPTDSPLQTRCQKETAYTPLPSKPSMTSKMD